MTWEYLQTKDLDGRFLLASGYLHDKIVGKNIVDLNCGTARLLLYLPQLYQKYFANDITFVPIKNYPAVDFQKVTDGQFVSYLKDKKVDIFCLFGHGGGHLLPNTHESPTLTASAIQIIKDHQPKIVILEACWDYVNNKRVLSDILDYGLEKEEYKIEQNIILKPSGNYNDLAKRQILILEK